jgi:hypothetical protein
MIADALKRNNFQLGPILPSINNRMPVISLPPFKVVSSSQANTHRCFSLHDLLIKKYFRYTKHLLIHYINMTKYTIRIHITNYQVLHVYKKKKNPTNLIRSFMLTIFHELH